MLSPLIGIYDISFLIIEFSAISFSSIAVALKPSVKVGIDFLFIGLSLRYIFSLFSVISGLDILSNICLPFTVKALEQLSILVINSYSLLIFILLETIHLIIDINNSLSKLFFILINFLFNKL